MKTIREFCGGLLDGQREDVREGESAECSIRILVRHGTSETREVFAEYPYSHSTTDGCNTIWRHRYGGSTDMFGNPIGDSQCRV